MLSRIRSDLPGIVWPPIANGASAVLAAMMGQLEDSQWLSADEIQERQFFQLSRLCDHLAGHSPQFRRRLDRADLSFAEAASKPGFAALPIMSRRDLQASEDLFCEVVPAGHAPLSENRTSGSTGEPVVVRRTQVSHFDWFGFTLREHFWRERDFSRKMCAIRAHIAEPTPAADWGRPANMLFDTGPSLGLPITTPISEQWTIIQDFKPDSLMVYPSNLSGLLDEADARGGGLDFLLHIRTVGETVSPDLRRRTAALTGLEIADCYSSQEIGYIAVQCPVSGAYHVMSEAVIVEVVDDQDRPCAPGQVGRVVVTDLHNFATPLVRYDIGDHAEVGEPCACGRGLPTLARILGRSRNLILMPDGSRHWPLVGFSRFRDIAPVEQYQLIQTDRDQIKVRLVVSRPLTGPEKDRLSAHIVAALGYPFRLELIFFDNALPTGAAGKFEEFISLV